MIFISAQPDQTYFIWQLELQLRNLLDLGICSAQIHVLVSFNRKNGLTSEFQKFIANNYHLATFYAYPDYRDGSKYTSSLRLNILKQHFGQYPDLERERLFYHDSDILLSRVPQVKNVELSETCYVSDTRNYLDVDYIRRTGSEQLLSDMAGIVGIPINVIEENKHHTGGAQYILKGINAGFWAKVERDSEALYQLMKAYNTKLWEEEYPLTKEYKSKKRGIQAWCADMWALLWNLWLCNKSVEIHPELDFSWPYDPIADWDKKAIQHYSGDIKEKDKFFKKTEYLNYMPWYDDALRSIPDASCSYRIVEHICQRKRELDSERPLLDGHALLLQANTSDREQLKTTQVAKRYYEKYLNIDIHIIDQHSTDGIIAEYRNRYSGILCLCPGCIVDSQIIQSILRDSGKRTLSISFEQVYKLDQLFGETFSRVLDIELLDLNKNKFNYLEPAPACCKYISGTKTMDYAKQATPITKVTSSVAYLLTANQPTS